MWAPCWPHELCYLGTYTSITGQRPTPTSRHRWRVEVDINAWIVEWLISVWHLYCVWCIISMHWSLLKKTMPKIMLANKKKMPLLTKLSMLTLNDDRITECNILDTRNSLTVYILLYRLTMECPSSDHGRWRSFNAHGAGTFVYPLITSLGTGTETCGVGNVFPPDYPWVGLDTNMNCTFDIWFTFKSLTGGVCHLYLFILTDAEKGWPMVSCPFLALVVLYRMLPILTWTIYHGTPLYHIYTLNSR